MFSWPFSGKQKLLLESEQLREENTLHYSATNGHVTIQQREMTPRTSKKGVADLNRHSVLSLMNSIKHVYIKAKVGIGGQSLVGPLS